ncbi:MAG: Rrf2 family transcriptional regulator, partial [Ectothiorhodospiraceae bacterium]|nr:Rrf2 family transcriptional regulator [Ectothiorhodospiraceae bacterium]
ISRHHVMKVVFHLGQVGYLHTVRGKGGGIRMGKKAEDINLGRLIREIEPDMRVVECFGADDRCRLSPECHLKGLLSMALGAFLEILDNHTLADVTGNTRDLQRVLGLSATP